MCDIFCTIMYSRKNCKYSYESWPLTIQYAHASTFLRRYNTRITVQKNYATTARNGEITIWWNTGMIYWRKMPSFHMKWLQHRMSALRWEKHSQVNFVVYKHTHIMWISQGLFNRSRLKVLPGVIISKSEMQDVPNMTWPVENNTYYTLIMTRKYVVL